MILEGVRRTVLPLLSSSSKFPKVSHLKFPQIVKENVLLLIIVEKKILHVCKS